MVRTSADTSTGAGTPSRKRKAAAAATGTADADGAAATVAAAAASPSPSTNEDATDRPAKKRTPNRRRRSRTGNNPGGNSASASSSPRTGSARSFGSTGRSASAARSGTGVPSVGNVANGTAAAAPSASAAASAAASAGAANPSSARERHGLLGLLPTRAERRNILESRAAEARARRRAQAEQAMAEAEEARRRRGRREAGMVVESAADFAEREVDSSSSSDEEEEEEEEMEAEDEKEEEGREERKTGGGNDDHEELVDTCSEDDEENEDENHIHREMMASHPNVGSPDSEGDEANNNGCSCAICFQTYAADQLVTLPCCGIVPNDGGGAAEEAAAAANGEYGGSTATTTNNNNNHKNNSRELSSTTRFCPTCMVTLATRTDNPQTAYVTIPKATTMRSTHWGLGLSLSRTHCRIGECPRCHHVLTVANVRRPTVESDGNGSQFSEEVTAAFGWTVQDLVLETATLGEIVRYACGTGSGGGGNGGGGGAGDGGDGNGGGNIGQVNANANANGQGNHAAGNGGGQNRGGRDANGQAQRAQHRMFQNQMMENIVGIVDAGGNAAALAGAAAAGDDDNDGNEAGRGNAGAGRGNAGAGRGAGADRGGGARRPPRAAAAAAVRNANEAAVNVTTGRYYGLFCFLAHTPSPDYIPADMVSRSTADEIFPKLVRWGILTELRRNKVYALREPVHTTQELIRDAMPSVLFDPNLNDRARENAERLRNLEVLPGLAGLNTPQEMDAAVNLALISMNCMGKALICLLRLRPYMALWVANQGLTTFWMALGVIPGRNGPPPAQWQRAITFVMNAAFLYLVLRGVFGILREALRSLPLAIIAVALPSALLSKRPPNRWALDLVLFYAYKKTKSSVGYVSYLVLHTLWGHFMPKKWTSECPYWLYGLTFLELFVGYHLYPDVPKFNPLDLATFVHGTTYHLAASFAKAATESADKIAVALLGGPGLAASALAQLSPFAIILFMLYQGIARFGKKYFIVTAVVSAAVLLAGAPR